jgi:hypothetical protein
MELHGFDVGTVEAVEEFFLYVQRFWFDRVGPTRFCVQNDSRRTNNHLESFYRKLNQKMHGRRLNLWIFISIITIKSSEVKLFKMEQAFMNNSIIYKHILI